MSTSSYSRSSVPSSSQPSKISKPKVWVDPASLPDAGDISTIHGNAPDYIKQLNNNTFFSYGVGNENCFGYQVGKEVQFVDINIDRKLERQGRLEATTVAEVTVNKRTYQCLALTTTGQLTHFQICSMVQECYTVAA
jgi:acyl-coenzyme A thioesterase 13